MQEVHQKMGTLRFCKASLSASHLPSQRSKIMQTILNRFALTAIAMLVLSLTLLLTCLSGGDVPSDAV
jgi:hypothetical protein